MNEKIKTFSNVSFEVITENIVLFGSNFSFVRLGDLSPNPAPLPPSPWRHVALRSSVIAGQWLVHHSPLNICLLKQRDTIIIIVSNSADPPLDKWQQQQLDRFLFYLPPPPLLIIFFL